MERGNQKLIFAYDSTGRREGFSFYEGNSLVGHYYYLYNAQGDVTGILNQNMYLVVSYTYDSWGKLTACEGDAAEVLGTLNPFRYRGYIYDEETKLYYLNSRYYDPETGRFLNADGISMLGANGDFASLNLFAYCGNNPVNRMDSAGYFWDLVLDILSLGMSIVEVVSNPKDPWAWAGLAGDVVDVVIPFAGGVGEITRGLKATANVTEAIGDTAEIVDDVVDTSKSLKTLRTNAVRKAWKNEVDLVRTTGKGTRAWTIEEIDELLNTGKVKGYVGHHMKSVKGYPELAGDPLNIQFLTPKQHLLAHGGNWRNITDGRYLE